MGDTHPVKSILFTCLDNASRSQIAEAFARMFGGTAIECFSAGLRPATEIDSRAIEFMADCGYDLSAHFPKSLSDIPKETFDVIVSVDGLSFEVLVPAHEPINWDIPLPDTDSKDDFQAMGVLIETKVRQLLEKL